MPDDNRVKTPRKLRSLQQSDLISIKDKNDDFLVVTKTETKNVIKDFVKEEFESLIEAVILNYKTDIGTVIESRCEQIEKVVDVYINYRFNQLSEKICEMLLHRKFDEEVERKVKEQLNKKGNF